MPFSHNLHLKHQNYLEHCRISEVISLRNGSQHEEDQPFLDHHELGRRNLPFKFLIISIYSIEKVLKKKH